MQILDGDARLRSFDKADLRELRVLTTSPMPAYGDRLDADELADLLAYSVYRAFKDEDLGYPYFERVPGTSPGGGREPRSSD